MISMHELRPFVQDLGGTVVELGSRDGHDAKAMTDIFGANRTITIEANPHCYANIVKTYPLFESYNCAIIDRTADVDFYAVRSSFPPENIGQSSTMYRDIYQAMADKVTVKGYTMDDFVAAHDIGSIEAMKIDVEGATYQVLSGFSKIRMTRLFHIECEHIEYWPGQQLYDAVAAHMASVGYEQVYFTYAYDQQSDSVWLRRD